MLWSFPLAIVLASIVAGQDRPTFRTDVSQVHVDAEVLSKDGRVITGLSKTDFRVFDEGQEQTLVGFAAEEQPLDIILLFDTSGSMRSAVEGVVGAAGQALRELRRGDRVSVMTFNTSTRLVLAFTDDLNSVENEIQSVVSLRFGGGTHIQEAVDDAAGYYLRDVRSYRRRAVLIITDNVGVRTRTNMSVVRSLWGADALLSGLIVRNPANRVRLAIVGIMAPYMLAKVGGIQQIAERTGGDAIHADNGGSAFPDMMRRIRDRYSLYYPLPGGRPGFRSIRVELAAEAQQRFSGAHVYARRGYRLTRP